MRSTITYTALGDSLTFGSGILFKHSFTKVYAKLLETRFHKKVLVHQFSKKGLTSFELMNDIQQSHWIKQAIKQSSIITISIGGNDLLQANRRFMKTKNNKEFVYTLHHFSNHIQYILAYIQSLKGNSPYIIQLIGLYNPFPYLSYSSYWINEYNRLLQSLENKHVQYIDTYKLFNQYGKRVLPLGIHPNKKGHDLIGKQLIQSYHFMAM